MEAPPNSPGHVGHTPQHVDVMINRARARGIETSGALTEYRPVPYAMQAFPGQQRYAALSTVATLLRLEDYHRRRDIRQPELLDYDAAIILGYNPPPAPTAAELRDGRRS